jgi:hypothetical protein
LRCCPWPPQYSSYCDTYENIDQARLVAYLLIMDFCTRQGTIVQTCSV